MEQEAPPNFSWKSTLIVCAIMAVSLLVLAFVTYYLAYGPP